MGFGISGLTLGSGPFSGAGAAGLVSGLGSAAFGAGAAPLGPADF